MQIVKRKGTEEYGIFGGDILTGAYQERFEQIALLPLRYKGPFSAGTTKTPYSKEEMIKILEEEHKKLKDGSNAILCLLDDFRCNDI